MTPVTDRGMLPLQHLLNPSVSPPETPSGSQKTSHIGASHSNIDTIHSTTTTPKHADSDASKRPEDSTILAKCRPRGPINFPPFEDVDDTALQQLSKFKVTPLGKIHQEFHHIPYSSSKKDLFDKTGRESIEGKILIPMIAYAYIKTRFKATVLIFIVANSFQIRIPGPWPRYYLHCDVGLQHWYCAHEPFHQMGTVSQGTLGRIKS